jgi:fumarate hydratase class II
MENASEAAPKILDVPIGLDATGMRKEFDSLGEVEVPANHYWGAQTQRSLEHFNIGNDRMPKEVYHAYGFVKKAAARVNTEAGRLPKWKGQLIERVCDEVISGSLDSEFPLFVWQTGSGTQSNMNLNEVISNRCIQLVGGVLGSQKPVHPNDHVNMGQSSNDTFPTAMHIAAHKMATDKTIPALRLLRDAIQRKSKKWANVVKTGRTHLEDAVPLTVGQEWSGYVGALDDAIAEVEHATRGLLKLAMGGTAVGTGLNAPAGFGEQVAAQIAAMTETSFETAANKFTAQGTLDRMVRAHAGLKAAAVTLFKIANDLRWLGSGPRTGIHELILPANEPGSSIMPGKVNPTQAEAMLMVAIQVIASDLAITMGGAEGNFELNAFRPILVSNYLHSALILADMCDHFRRFMIEGAEVNEAKLKDNIDRSVMMVTALSPVIGYDEASVISHYAIDHDLTLKQAALANGVGEGLFDKIVNPLALTRGGSADLQSGNGQALHGADRSRSVEARRRACRQSGSDCFGRRPARLGRLEESGPPTAAAASRVHWHGRPDLRLVRGCGHPGSLRRPRLAALADGSGAVCGVRAMAGCRRLFPRRHLRSLQPSHDAGVRAAARHERDDGGRLLGRPVWRCDLRIVAGAGVLRDCRQPRRNDAATRPILAGSRIRGDPYLRPDTYDPEPGQRAEAQRPVRAACGRCVHLRVGQHGGPLRRRSHEPGQSLRT